MALDLSRGYAPTHAPGGAISPVGHFRTTTDSQHAFPIAPNVLARRFTAPAPTVWVTDMTYLWTLEGWLYLVVILDLFSRPSWAGR